MGASPLSFEHAADRSLVRRLLAGDERAFDAWFEESYPRLYRFALARTGDDELAREVAQSALARAVTKLASWRGEASLLTWLTTFCRHELHAALERRGRGAAVPLDEEQPEVRAALESLATAFADPADAALRAERVRLVHLVLDWLPAHYAEALSLKYLDELPVAEIARRMALSEKAAESLLTRARAAFRDGFAELGFAGETP